ncbi:hypothetical protein FVE85_6707 [Porphyridium purpureum]|uniref:Uncharacterized protein n=1 Tax=Porphyridium purpureum TaxID=35688 RepID=A0A5J4Z7U8_PORPP|nr:hypothetical protein FVE85_6707 [Porphyridium purpureum]|eukprot:POR6978..scf295_1
MTILSVSWELEKLLHVDWPELKRAPVQGQNGVSELFGDVYMPLDKDSERGAPNSRTLVVLVPSHTRETFVRALKYAMYAEAINSRADVLFMFDSSVRPHEAAVFMEELMMMGRADYIRWFIDLTGGVFRAFSAKRSLWKDPRMVFRRIGSRSLSAGDVSLPYRELNFVLLEFPVRHASAAFRPSLSCALLDREVFDDACGVLLGLNRVLDIDLPCELLARDEELVLDYQRNRCQNLHSRDLLRGSSGLWAGSRTSLTRLSAGSHRSRSDSTVSSISPTRVDARSKLAMGEIKPRQRTKSTTITPGKQKLARAGLSRNRSVTRPEVHQVGAEPIERIALVGIAF